MCNINALNKTIGAFRKLENANNTVYMYMYIYIYIYCNTLTNTVTNTFYENCGGPHRFEFCRALHWRMNDLQVIVQVLVVNVSVVNVFVKMVLKAFVKGVHETVRKDAPKRRFAPKTASVQTT